MSTHEELGGRQYVACITGASRGIGNAIAQCLAPHCSHMLLTARHEAGVVSAAKAIESRFGNQVHSYAGDLFNGREVADAMKTRLAGLHSRLDILVLNAGYYVEGSIADMADDDFERNMRVNCLSSRYIVSALLPFLRQSGYPRIFIIGSTAAYEAYPLVPTYGIAKWGLRGFAVNLRKELVPDSIGVTFIAPGGTLTDMWQGVDLPERRLLEPCDIGKLIVAIMTLSTQAVVEELIVRPMLGDIHE